MCVAQILRRVKELGKANLRRRFKTCTKCATTKPRGRFSKSVCTRDGLNYWCKVCMKRISKKYLKNKRRQGRIAAARLRLEILQYYSRCKKPFCACCRVSILEFLGIDHIKGGGAKHKRIVRHLYRWLKKNGFPKGFRVLCHNCNQSLGAYGYCPHDKSKH